jgi:hypothetical protein
MMTKAISTAGQSSIQVEYDVMAALNVPPAGAASGSCPVLEGSSEDKLVVYYSTTGTGGPWTAAQVLSEGAELPTDWTRKSINLAAVPSVGNNPNFALRFQWQFNSATDTGRVDNVRVLGGAVTAQMPAIAVTPAAIDRTIQAGNNLPSELFKISNTGEGLLNFTISNSVPWLSVSPLSSSSSGPERAITINWNTAPLAVGDYLALVQILSGNALNSPQSLPVNLRVIPPVCYWEPFSYYNGNLNTMAAANWSGTASNQIVTESGLLKFIGGGGSVTSRHLLLCPGSNGVIAVQIKVKKGTGSGDFFWSIYIDDDTGDTGNGNLARWYGGSTLVRGRIGTTITPDMPLSGPNTWDDLYIRIDTIANTSTFFFNGVFYGTISHSATATSNIGAVRLERLDRTTAGGDFILFDNLTIGAPDNVPPHLNMARTGPQLTLSWPAEAMGSTLQTTTNLTPPATWTSITNPLPYTNGQSIFTTNTISGRTFYRLRKP